MTLPKTIMVAHDFGDGSDAALTYAIDLARALGASLVVMHAYDVPVVSFPDGTLVATAEMTSTMLDGVNEGVARVLRSIEGSGVTARSLVRQGEAWRAIVAAAEETGVGMIVMGTHGRRGLTRALLGSVAERVVRAAHCPVLTIHAAPQPERDDLHRSDKTAPAK